MEKNITTGTKITFTQTNDKFELIQTDTGFDVKPIKLSKNIPTEHYTFRELLQEYENNKITIQGFEETDTPLIKSIFTNFIHTTEIETLKAEIIQIIAEKEALKSTNQELIISNDTLTAENKEITAKNEKLNAALVEMQ